MCRLATEARYRGRGVASQLLARLERTASILGCGRVTLETSTSHEAAVRLYTRRGYTQVLRCVYVSVQFCLLQGACTNYFPVIDFVQMTSFEKAVTRASKDSSSLASASELASPESKPLETVRE